MLISTALILTVAACNSKKDDTDKSEQQAEQKAEDNKGAEAAPAVEVEKTLFPKGTMTIYGYGNPQYLQYYYDDFLERHRDIAPEVEIKIVQAKNAQDAREKISMTYLSGALKDLPTCTYIDPVGLKDLANGDMILDMTDFLTPLLPKMVEGATVDGMVDGKMYGLPESVRPQLLFYNKSIFDEYGIDPSQMTTIEKWIEVGRELKEKSGGKTYLSYIDPGKNAWRYYGRRGLMPQANGRIWDDEGKVVMGTDPGTKKAMETLDTLMKEDLLFKSTIFEPPLYDACRKHQVATFYIGAFWDEFLRKNVPEMAGEWRVMNAPVFEKEQQGGAPVTGYFVILNNPDDPYTELAKMLWEDFTFNTEQRTKWVKRVDSENGPYANPISLEMLDDAFWKEPSDYYGGQSFRTAEAQGLQNPSKNLPVTAQDAEADVIISAELEAYVAGNQTMEEALQNMQKNLEGKIGQSEVK